VFAVRGAQPLASGPARLTHLGDQDFTLRVSRPGAVRVLVHFTPYWRITAGAGCVQQGPGDWTVVRAARPGDLRVSAGFSLDRVFDRGPRCTAGVRA
jgi:hypothetical protein